MEEPQEPGVGSPFSFPSHRRSHLKSGTYRNLVRLIILCYGDSPLATAPPIIPLLQTPGGDDVKESGEMIVSDSKEPANMADRMKDVGLKDKKKQCPTPAEKKEKKKRNKQQKRAEKNRQLGVKRARSANSHMTQCL